MDTIGQYWTLLDTIGHCWTLLDTGHCWILLDTTGLYGTLDTAGHYWTLLYTIGHYWTVVHGHYRTLLDGTEHYWTLRDTGHCGTLLDTVVHYWTLLDCSAWTLSDTTGRYCTLLDTGLETRIQRAAMKLTNTTFLSLQPSGQRSAMKLLSAVRSDAVANQGTRCGMYSFISHNFIHLLKRQHNYTQKNESEHLTNQQHETLKNAT